MARLQEKPSSRWGEGSGEAIQKISIIPHLWIASRDSMGWGRALAKQRNGGF